MDKVSELPEIPHTTDPAPEPTTDLSMADFRAAAAAQWRSSVLADKVSCVELTTMALTTAATMNSLGAFLSLDPEFALARAEQQDRTLEILRKHVTPQQLAHSAPLIGLPTAFKDLVPVAGLPVTMGTTALSAEVPAEDAPLARTVHHAGGISIGKTQVPEFGLPCYSENQLGLPARNPLAPDRTAGGSSGGAAAAVAAGILPFAPGNDGGGSVRIPAAACGLVGLKPGRQRIPDDASSASVRNLAVSGPIANTAEDAALLFDVMAQQGTRAQQAVKHAKLHGAKPVQIAMTTESPFTPDLDIVLAEDAVMALEQGAAGLSGLGHRVQGAGQHVWTQHYHQNFQTLWTAGLGQREFSDAQIQMMEPLTQYFIELAGRRPEKQTAAAIAALQDFADHAEQVFGNADVLLTPMLAFAPPELGWFAAMDPAENYIQQCRFTPYSSVVNVLGLPAVNVPMHTSADGLSWSVQLIGKRGTEEQLLALAAMLMSAQNSG